MTNRLYYDDAYLTEFDAEVVCCEAREDGFHVRLDRSAFYPTSGGQPYDTGFLGGAAVKDVYVGADGDVWHVLDQPLCVGEAVHGKIDWTRRFDHMQQHAADHMIASALWRHMGGVTIGLHISAESSTIDVAMPEGVTRISPEQIRRIEDDVNERVWRDVPVRCWFPDEEELKALPLRKPPTVSEHVRIVAIGEDEMVACGGTHPSTAGQLGIVKILSVTPARGKMRVCFVAGRRAFNDYRTVFDCAHAAAAELSTGVEQLTDQVKAMQESLHSAHQALNHLREEALVRALEEKVEAAPRTADGVSVIRELVEGDAALIKEAASKLIRRDGVVVLLGAKGEDGRVMFVFARSKDVSLDMGRLLGQAAKPLGGKGGGRPDFAQGGGPEQVLEAAERLIMA